MSRISETLVPRNGHTLNVGIVARISGGPNQKEMSLEDQEDHGHQVVAELYDGPAQYQVIATIGKGERLDRPELAEIESLLRSRTLDLLIAEDIGRIVRGTEASWLCGIAVDHGTRVIAPNDCIDTADENWEEEVISACRDHVGHNSHTSKRLKKKLMNRFTKFGGAPARPIFGYDLPEGAKTYDDWRKNDDATLIYREWFARLKRDRSGSLVADWLNQLGVSTGPYARNSLWDGRMVLRVTRNPLLKGMPGRGFRRSVKHHETGRRVSGKSPDKPNYYACPHLLHVPPEEFDEVNDLLKYQNAGMGRKPRDGKDPRDGVPKKSTVSPGQHASCGVCGRLFYWGGHGQTSHMMCSGSRDYLCWNTGSFNGHEARQRIANAIFGRIERLPEFDEIMRKQIEGEAAVYFDQSNVEETRLAAEQSAVSKQVDRLIVHMMGSPKSEALAKKLQELESRLLKLRLSLLEIRGRRKEIPTLPSVADLKVQIKKSPGTLAATDPEFGRIMRMLAPQIRIYPFRTIDLGRVVARSLVTLDLTSLIRMSLAAAAGTVLRETFWVNLHEQPQYVALREQIVAMLAQGLKQREVAAELGTHQATVQRAMTLHRQMLSLGILDPYQVQTCPSDSRKHKRMPLSIGIPAGS